MINYNSSVISSIVLNCVCLIRSHISKKGEERIKSSLPKIIKQMQGS